MHVEPLGTEIDSDMDNAPPSLICDPKSPAHATAASTARPGQITAMISSTAPAPASRTWGALIDGPGGMGKTSLAVRAADAASPRKYCCRSWLQSSVFRLSSRLQFSREYLKDIRHRHRECSAWVSRW